MAQRLSRRRRRLLVAGVYVGLISYAGTLLALENPSWLWLGLGGLLTTMAIHFWLLRPFTQRIADTKESDLDERQRTVRNRAYYSAYQVLGSVVITALLYWHLDVQQFEGALPSPDVTGENATSLFVGILWLIITLPTSIIAWNEPDPDEEDGT